MRTTSRSALDRSKNDKLQLLAQPFVAGIDRHYVGAVAGSVHAVRGHQYPSSERALMPPRICMRPLIIAVALTSKWFVRRRLLSRAVIASAHAHLASSSVASTRWQCRSVPMANFSLNILLDIVGGKAAVGEAAKAAAMAGSTSTSHEKPRHASAGPHNTRSPRRDYSD